MSPSPVLEPTLECPAASGCEIIARTNVSPFAGEVTTWRMEGASAAAGYYIEVLRKSGKGTFTVTAASAPVVSTGSGLQTFATPLPIAAGEYIGLVTPPGATAPLLDELAAGYTFRPAPVGENLTPIGGGSGPEEVALVPLVAFNFDVETPPPAKEVITKTEIKTVEDPAKSTPEAHCVVPKLTGKTLATAKKALKAAQCKVGFVIRPRGTKAAKAKVTKTLPKAGTALPVGTPVSLKLG